MDEKARIPQHSSNKNFIVKSNHHCRMVSHTLWFIFVGPQTVLDQRVALSMPDCSTHEVSKRETVGFLWAVVSCCELLFWAVVVCCILSCYCELCMQLWAVVSCVLCVVRCWEVLCAVVSRCELLWAVVSCVCCCELLWAVLCFCEQLCAVVSGW